MTLTAVTVTVYFVGLVNFYKPSLGTREVILPLATTSIRTLGVDLAAHTGSVIIDKGIDSAGCATLLGSWNGTICIVPHAEIVGKKIVLSASTTTPLVIDSNFEKLPTLQTLCTGLGALNKNLSNPSEFTARLTLTTGTLNTCIVGDALVSYLTYESTDGKFSIGGKTATLTGTEAMVEISNHASGSTDGRVHFWWYYTLYNNSSSCTNMPCRVCNCDTSIQACPREIIDHHGSLAASGVGCSNSAYP